MSWAVAAPAMLWGLLGISIPVIIHLLSRRRAVTIDWGAMQFLDLGRRAQRRLQITELLLMAGRMLLLALVALAVARPFWEPKSAGAAGRALAGSKEPRDYVLILDGSDSMDRKLGETTPRKLAVAWARKFVANLTPGDSVCVLSARDRVQSLTDGLSYDLPRVTEILKNSPPPRGSSDLPAALAESLRVLESGRNSASEVIVLSDGQRLPWRPGEPTRWALLRDLHKGLKSRAPRLAAIAFGADLKGEGADASVAPLELPRGVYPPGGAIAVTSFVANGGPGPATRTAELLIDGIPVAGTAQAIGPIPPGGKSPLAFRATISAPGSHLLTIWLSGGDDPLPANDVAERPVEVAEALPVLIVDGEPSAVPLAGEADFLRAALAPAEDDAPAVRARVIRLAEFGAEALKGQRVLVLANVDRLSAPQMTALSDFLGAGGGVLIAPGDRSDAEFYNTQLFADGSGSLPAKLGDRRGDFGRRQVVAHPAPRTFTGPALGPFGVGDSPALAEADLFGYRVLAPAAGSTPAAVVARLDTGDPWAVERPSGKGRVLLLAGPIDAEGGTLPVNPDFVPLVHELIYRLADPAADNRPTRPGEPIRFELAEVPPAGLKDVAITRPDGLAGRAPIVREGSNRARIQIDDATEPGIYRLTLPGPSGGTAFVSVAGDGRESDAEPLAPEEARRLADGWPLVFESDPDRLETLLLSASGSGPRPLWRGLVLAALGGLCLEVWMTRKLVMSRGMTAVEEGGS